MCRFASSVLAWRKQGRPADRCRRTARLLFVRLRLPAEQPSSISASSPILCSRIREWFAPTACTTVTSVPPSAEKARPSLSPSVGEAGAEIVPSVAPEVRSTIAIDPFER